MKKWIRNCPTCDGEIEYKNKWVCRRAEKSKTQCNSCASKAKAKKTGKEVSCMNCGTITYKPLHQLKAAKAYYCSVECQHTHRVVPRLQVECSLDGCNNLTKPRTEKELSKKKVHYCSVKCASKAGIMAASKSRKYKRTKPEIKFGKILEELGIESKFQYYVEWKRGWKKFYDYYLPDYNLLVEVDGVYWHGKNKKYHQLNEQQKQTRDNDIIKNELAIKRGYKLMRIWSDELDTFKHEIKSYDRSI